MDFSALMVQYMIDNNITPVVDYLKVGRIAEFYKIDSNVFVKTTKLRSTDLSALFFRALEIKFGYYETLS